VMKYYIDRWQTKFFVSGSSSYYLKNLFPESLTGRKLVFELFPLTFSEFLIFKNQKKEAYEQFKEKAINKNLVIFEKYKNFYKEYLEYGGFPAVVLEPSYDRKTELLGAIFTSYFEKDVKTISDIKDVNRLRDLILLLIPRIGSKVDISRLALELALSRETIYSYLAFLEQTYLIKLLPKFSSSVDRKVSGQKKLYFSDTGIANHLGKLSMGQLFENSVFQNLRVDFKLSYYSKNPIQEIDFIIDSRTALEAKITATQKDVNKLSRYAARLDISESYLVTYNFSDIKISFPATEL